MHTAICWPAGATAADEANNLIIIIYFFRVAPLRTSKRRDSLLWDSNVLERVHVYFVWPNDFAIKLQDFLGGFYLAFFFLNQIFVYEIKANHTHTASFSHRFASNSPVTVFLLCVKQQQRQQQHWAKK